MPQAGIEQARAVMKDLAASPHTAHHIAVKLARHFVADDPPPALVAELRAHLPAARGGELGEVAKTLVDWRRKPGRPQRKFKTPYEFLVSGWRAAGVSPEEPEIGRS